MLKSGNGLLLVGAIIVGTLTLLALLAPWIAPYGYDALDLGVGRQNLGPSMQHLLGTDDLGRDIFSRLLYGARVSLGIAFAVQVSDFTLGAGLGLISGYYGGWVDLALMRVTDVMFAFPDLLLAILIMGILQARVEGSPSLLALWAALAVVSWPNMARLVRSQTLSLRQREFVEAARAIGCSDSRILFRHLLPNVLGPVVVMLATSTAGVILAESTLSFLGIGVQPPYPSWGIMVNQGMERFRSEPAQVMIPALTLALAVFGFNFLGDGLRDRLYPRMR